MQLADYLKELRKVKTLDHEEEQALWTAFKERGDEEARQRLIESYQPLVFKQAAPFAQLDCAQKPEHTSERNPHGYHHFRNHRIGSTQLLPQLANRLHQGQRLDPR